MFREFASFSGTIILTSGVEIEDGDAFLEGKLSSEPGAGTVKVLLDSDTALDYSRELGPGDEILVTGPIGVYEGPTVDENSKALYHDEAKELPVMDTEVVIQADSLQTSEEE